MYLYRHIELLRSLHTESGRRKSKACGGKCKKTKQKQNA